MAHERKFYWIEFPSKLDVIFHFIDSFTGKLSFTFVLSCRYIDRDRCPPLLSNIVDPIVSFLRKS